MQKQEIDIDKVIQFMITNGLHRNLASEHPLFTSENNDYLLTLTLYPTNNSKDVELLIKNKFNNRCIEVYLQPCERRVILQNVQLALDKGREKTGFDCFCKDESHKSKTKKSDIK